MKPSIVINENPPIVRWKEKMSILMVTFIMVGVWLISIPWLGYFNGKIIFKDLFEILGSLAVFSLGTFLTYLGMSSSYTTVYLKNHNIVVERQIGLLRFYKQYDLSDGYLVLEEQEDEDGILWYHLVKHKPNEKLYILKNLEAQNYEALKNFIVS